jgi:hypothetical protein
MEPKYTQSEDTGDSTRADIVHHRKALEGRRLEVNMGVKAHSRKVQVDNGKIIGSLSDSKLSQWIGWWGCSPDNYIDPIAHKNLFLECGGDKFSVDLGVGAAYNTETLTAESPGLDRGRLPTPLNESDFCQDLIGSEYMRMAVQADGEWNMNVFNTQRFTRNSKDFGVGGLKVAGYSSIAEYLVTSGLMNGVGSMDGSPKIASVASSVISEAFSELKVKYQNIQSGQFGPATLISRNMTADGEPVIEAMGGNRRAEIDKHMSELQYQGLGDHVTMERPRKVNFCYFGTGCVSTFPMDVRGNFSAETKLNPWFAGQGNFFMTAFTASANSGSRGDSEIPVPGKAGVPPDSGYVTTINYGDIGGVAAVLQTELDREEFSRMRNCIFKDGWKPSGDSMLYAVRDFSKIQVPAFTQHAFGSCPSFMGPVLAAVMKQSTAEGESPKLVSLQHAADLNYAVITSGNMGIQTVPYDGLNKENSWHRNRLSTPVSDLAVGLRESRLGSEYYEVTDIYRTTEKVLAPTRRNGWNTSTTTARIDPHTISGTRMDSLTKIEQLTTKDSWQAQVDASFDTAIMKTSAPVGVLMRKYLDRFGTGKLTADGEVDFDPNALAKIIESSNVKNGPKFITDINPNFKVGGRGDISSKYCAWTALAYTDDDEWGDLGAAWFDNPVWEELLAVGPDGVRPITPVQRNADVVPGESERLVAVDLTIKDRVLIWNGGIDHSRQYDGSTGIAKVMTEHFDQTRYSDRAMWKITNDTAALSKIGDVLNPAQQLVESRNVLESSIYSHCDRTMSSVISSEDDNYIAIVGDDDPVEGEFTVRIDQTVAMPELALTASRGPVGEEINAPGYIYARDSPASKVIIDAANSGKRVTTMLIDHDTFETVKLPAHTANALCPNNGQPISMYLMVTDGTPNRQGDMILDKTHRPLLTTSLTPVTSLRGRGVMERTIMSRIDQYNQLPITTTKTTKEIIPEADFPDNINDPGKPVTQTETQPNVAAPSDGSAVMSV